MQRKVPTLDLLFIRHRVKAGILNTRAVRARAGRRRMTHGPRPAG